MYKISLVNMPFANPSLPSIALTQLKSVVEQRFGERVRVRVLYLNQECAHFVGSKLYKLMLSAVSANNSGLGDWLFRQVAFPHLPDNTQAYFQRYFPYQEGELAELKGMVVAKRAALGSFLARLCVKHRLAEESFVGFTSMFSQNVASMAMARIVKERNARVVTVLGGANCEAPMGREIAAHIEPIDFVFSGPALISLPRFLQHQLDGEQEKCQRIAGVFTAENADSEHLEGPGAFGQELPIENPVPLDYDGFLSDLERNFPDGRIQPSLTFETSRGCWWGERSHCTFCGLNGSTMMYRAMPPEQALALIRGLVDKYSDRCKRFESVDNIMPREYLTDVFAKLAPPPGVSIFYEVKADLKEREMGILSSAGVTEVQPGIESLATSTLKLMRKGTTSFRNVAFLKDCLRHKIKPSWNLLIGFPGESEEIYKKYLLEMPTMVHLPPPSGAHPVRFDRYSPYFVRAAAYGLDLAPYEFYRFVYPIDEEETLHNMAYYFEDRNYDAEYLTQMIAWKDKLNAATQRWHQRWKGSDGAVPAELRVRSRDGRTIIHDSRSGEIVEHGVGPLCSGILEFLHDRGWGLRDVARRLKADEDEVAEEIERCRGLGLLFEENGRFISLVSSSEDAAPSFGWAGAVDTESATTGAVAGAP